MPMGVTHRAINTVVSVPVAAGTLYIGWSPLQIACLVGGYTFATFLMNPDLDLDSIGYQSWGWLRIIWWPYQKALGHRCWMSHFPIISTLLRIIYLLWFPVLLLLLLGSSIRAMVRQEVLDWFPELAPYLLLLIFGMILSDTLHTILDTSSTELKQLFGGSRRRKRNVNFFEHHHQAPPRRASSRKSRDTGYNKRATNQNRR
jgi:uncharacterized metal-binding protein